MIRHDDSAVESNPNSTTSLELGMAGMNLISSSKNNGIKSRSPVPNSGDSVQSIQSTGTAGSLQNDSFTSGANINRPPGLAGLNVQAIGKPGHVKTSSNSSTAVTLTPTSSVDGANDLYAGIGGRGQSSPSTSDLPGIHSLGSFDKDDGLTGLQALRERSQSSPGPSSNASSLASAGYAASPREFSANARGFVPQSQQQGRPRMLSKDGGRSVSGSSRPPLAGGSTHSVDGLGFQSSGSRSRDASPTPNTGVIVRPDSFSGYGGSMNDSLDSSLQRAFSSDAVGEYSNYAAQNRQMSDNLNSTFAPAGLGNQRGGLQGQIPGLHGAGGLYPNHHGSQSQQGLRSLSGADYYHEANYEAGFIPQRTSGGPEADYSMQQHQDVGYHHGHQHQHQPRGPHRRSMSMQHSPYNESDNGQGMYGLHQRQTSLGRPDGPLQRRKSDFGVTGGISDMYERDRLGNNYHRQERLVSPAHSPMHSSYGSHNRHPSDISGASTASPSLSMGSGVSGTMKNHIFVEPCFPIFSHHSIHFCYSNSATIWSPPPSAFGRRSLSSIGWRKH